MVLENFTIRKRALLNYVETLGISLGQAITESDMSCAKSAKLRSGPCDAAKHVHFVIRLQKYLTIILCNKAQKWKWRQRLSGISWNPGLKQTHAGGFHLTNTIPPSISSYVFSFLNVAPSACVVFVAAWKLNHQRICVGVLVLTFGIWYLSFWIYFWLCW